MKKKNYIMHYYLAEFVVKRNFVIALNIVMTKSGSTHSCVENQLTFTFLYSMFNTTQVQNITYILNTGSIFCSIKIILPVYDTALE